MLVQREQTIPCPVCKTAVKFDARQLLQGTKFTCPDCKAEIGLAAESRGVVEEALNAFEAQREKIKGKSQ